MTLSIRSLPDHFTVRPWLDPAVESCGFPVNSVYTETVLLPILGPSSVLCLRRLGAWAAFEPDGTVVDARQLAGDLGLGEGTARNSPITRTLNRLCQFGMADWHDGGLSIRTAVAPLPERHLRRLSEPVLQLHYTLVYHAEARRRAAVANGAAVRRGVETAQTSVSTGIGAGW